MIHFICFSYNRPLQIHGYLTSLFNQCQGDFKVSVLVRVSNQYAHAYRALHDEFKMVDFVQETNFSDDVRKLVSSAQAELTCFGCDDVVFVEPFTTDAIHHAFVTHSLLGLSLRLGDNITRDMFGAELSQPLFLKSDTDWLHWSVDDPASTGDWAYPWEVLGTVYQTAFVAQMCAQMQPANPSQLEDQGTRLWAKLADGRMLAAYPTSRLLVPTVNLVQTDFPGNGIKGGTPLSPEFLLICWTHGLRLDTERLEGLAPESWRIPHFFLRRLL